MKLVYISNSRMPIEHAHGLQVMQMCDAFVENKWEVELVVPRRVNPIKSDPFSHYGIKKTFSITKIMCLDLIFLNNKNIFFWIQTVTFLFFTKISLLFKKYDIIYTREQAVGLFFNNFVLEIHSLPKTTRPFHKKIWKKAKHLVVLTPFIKERIVACGIPKDKILVAPDGVNLEKFNVKSSKDEVREKLGLPKENKLIGYVGAFRTIGMEKGIDTAIQAMKVLPETDSLLVLVGGHSADIEFYNKLVKELGIEKKVIFIGRIKYDIVPLYLKAFDVLIAPFPENEHYSFYMSPMKIFEYMAARKPIISTNLPSLHDIIGNGEAVLVAPGNAEELSLAINRVLTNKDMAEDLAQKAYTRVLGFTWQDRAKGILDSIKGN